MQFESTDIMPFGKHKDKQMKDIPTSYLSYLTTKIKEKSKIHWTLTDKLLVGYFENLQTISD